MALAMTRMVEMCEQMLKREMAMLPYVVIASVSLGLLLFIVLVLLIILQVQWK